MLQNIFKFWCIGSFLFMRVRSKLLYVSSASFGFFSFLHAEEMFNWVLFFIFICCHAWKLIFWSSNYMFWVTSSLLGVYLMGWNFLYLADKFFFCMDLEWILQFMILSDVILDIAFALTSLYLLHDSNVLIDAHCFVFSMKTYLSWLLSIFGIWGSSMLLIYLFFD